MYLPQKRHVPAPKHHVSAPETADTCAGAFLAEHNGILTPEEAQECLALVHWKDLVWDNGTVEDTQYSNVYDQQALTLRLRNWNTYETTNTFRL